MKRRLYVKERFVNESLPRLGRGRTTTSWAACGALAGYQKVSLRPGQSRRIRIEVGVRGLNYSDAATHGWRLGTGSRTVSIGSSSSDLPLTAQVRIR